MGVSTRLEIVRRALDDALARLNELPASAETRGLRVRALTYQHALDRWNVASPTEQQRGSLMNVVLELHADVMRASREATEGDETGGHT
jgi:hypothetical protein